MSWPLIAGTVSAMCGSFAFGCRAWRRTCSIHVINRHGSVSLPVMNRFTTAYASQAAQVQARWSVGIASDGRPSATGDKLLHLLASSRSQRRTDGTSGWTRVVLCDPVGDIWVTICSDCLRRRAAAHGGQPPLRPTPASSRVQPAAPAPPPSPAAIVVMYRNLVVRGAWRFWY